MRIHIIDGPNQAFAARLLEARRKASITQQELADKAGIDKRNISLYENGHARPRGETIRKLADELDCDADWLANGFSAEEAKYLEDQHQVQKPLIPRVRPIYIENWTSLPKQCGLGIGYSERSKPELFVHWVETTLSNLRATRYPGTYPDNPEFPSGTVLIFDVAVFTENRLRNGDVVIFRTGNCDSEPGLRRFVRDPGIGQSMLMSLSLGLPAIPFDKHDIQIIGVVVGQLICHK